MPQDDGPSFILPRKLRLYLQRLHIDYHNRGETVLRRIVNDARWTVSEGQQYDSWNNDGHAVTFFAAPALLGLIALDQQDDICEQIRKDINKAARGVENEYISSVAIELEDQNDPAFQASNDINARTVDAPQFWLEDHIRVFISHRDTHKKLAHKLAEDLVLYGCSGFVAHDTIEPDTEWQREIEKGLATMEVMVALITDDFFESVWTNQEIGFALGRNIPVISIKTGAVAPRGFIQGKQAIPRGQGYIQLLYEKISARVGHGRVVTALVSRLITASSFSDTRSRFDRLAQFGQCDAVEAGRIIKAYEENRQLSACYYLNNENRLINYLSRSTGKHYELKQNRLIEQQ